MLCKVPSSYISNEEAKKRKDHFNSRRLPNLKKWVKQQGEKQEETEYIIIPVEEFRKFLEYLQSSRSDGLRVYFATRGFVNALSLKKYHLTFVFAPTIAGINPQIHIDEGKYFVVSDQNLIKEITETEAAVTVAIHQTSKKGYCERYATRPHPGRGLDDTTSVWHLKRHITEWLDLLDCLGNVTDVRFYVCAYYEDKNLKDGTKLEVKDQLSFYIKLYNGNKLINLEKYPWFPAKTFDLSAYDTGDPCPPPRTGCKQNGARLSIK